MEKCFKEGLLINCTHDKVLRIMPGMIVTKKQIDKAMAIDWGKYGIQAHGIGPGYFKTELTEALVNDEKFSSWLISRTPAKRWGNVEDLVGAAVFLSSAASQFVNGHILYVDGGVTATL